MDEIVNILVKAAVDSIGAVIANYAKNKGNDEIATTKFLANNLSESLSRHLLEIHAWSEEISFRELLHSKQLTSSFVDIDLSLSQTRMRGSKEQPDRSYKVSDLSKITENIVLLGDAGAGKTTTVKKLILDILHQSGSYNQPEKANIPILIKLRNFDQDDNLVQSILRVCGLHIDYKSNDISPLTKKEYEFGLLMTILNNVEATVFIDGLDEAPQVALVSILQDLERMLLRSTEAKIIITCRSANFRYNLNKAIILELTPLTDDQIQQFASKWLGEERGKMFLNEIRKSPYAGTEVRPLTLAHLCAIYERKGEIPKQPKLIYKTIVRLLLTDWDEQRRIKRGSAYENFTTDQKEEFLEAIAFDMYSSGIRGVFAHDKLREFYVKNHQRYGLPAGHEEAVAREIESHTGLIAELGYSEYQFTHLVLQEYLTAQYLLKLPALPWEPNIILSMPEPFAIAVSLSSNPNAYFIEIARSLIQNIRSSQLEQFAGTFLKRLSVEKPLFSPDAVLGAAAVLFFAEAHGLSRKSVGEIWSYKSFYEFFRLPEIAISLHEFVKFWNTAEVSGKHVRITINNAEFQSEFGMSLSEALRLTYPSTIGILSDYVPLIQGK